MEEDTDPGASTPLEEGHGWKIAENIGVGYDTPEAIVEAWRSSPSHRAHLLSPNFDSIGIGYTVVENDESSSTHYWTQVLGMEA